MSDISGYLMVNAKHLNPNITCELVPVSPPTFSPFCQGEEEPLNEAMKLLKWIL